MDKGTGSLEETPTWAVSIFCLFFFILAFAIDAGLHSLTKFLSGGKRKSLNKALEKSKTEMMKMGLISLLLTISEVPISNICVSQSVAKSFRPCKDPVDYSAKPAVSSSATQLSRSESNSSLSVEYPTQNYCESKGMVSLISKEGVLQLNIFISVLAVFHVLYCIITMFLGIAKTRRWKSWEEETQTLEYQIANDPRRFQYSEQTLFGQRHLKFWSNHTFLLWPVCLVRQFTGSVSKVDYLTLRNGFLMANVAEGSNFNFQKFLTRAYDDDFEQVMGIRFWIWIFSVLFIFLSADVFYNYYWLPFIPLVIVLVVGAKLEVIISKMCIESFKDNPVIRGSFIVKPKDDLFWFGRPNWLLNLLQFVLIQNSFQLAFFTWTWFEYGQRSCFHRTKEDIAITITMGVVVQFLCGYVTLPLYALVTQMGSGMKQAVFTETVVKGLNNWHRNARRSLSRNRSTSTRRSSNSSLSDIRDFAIDSDQQTKNIVEYEHLPKTPTITRTSDDSTSTTSPEIVEDQEVPKNPIKDQNHPDRVSLSNNQEVKMVEGNRKIGTVAYDGEISFGSSWKKLGNGKEIGEVNSIIEEDASTILTNVDL
ncbi:MLO-like protein 12 [Ziziphus jujuba]|uniref:MLO-like protein n=1 Tax=Ziziphus jujuba TaxID=326968 RepID=A0A6P6FNV3_ZIZJJ|nr:MLO-like protein 12 [Ziziphus jujuba]